MRQIRNCARFLTALYVLVMPVLVAAGETDKLVMDETEVSIRAFAQFAQETGFVSQAERQGGLVYEAGWQVKPGWNWRRPYGQEGGLDEPAVHITFDEAQAYCKWKNGRLPTRTEWIEFGYTEQRPEPPSGFVYGKVYPYPTGDTPEGANCLSECKAETLLKAKKQDFGPVLNRGYGHAPVGVTKQGVTGLFDMGANVWEWAEISPSSSQQATMGGSWWYGARQMQADYGATKPRDMAAVYIGFRCISEKQ